MKLYHVNYSKGQMKIQQMAFVLVALVIFFALVAVAYLAISSRSLEKSAENIREDRVKETLEALAGTPELSWTADDCASCIDMDKAIALKDIENYRIFWNTPFLQIKRIYPAGENVECGLQNYPDCQTITLLETDEDFITKETFVSLCRVDESERHTRCEMGKILMGVKG